MAKVFKRLKKSRTEDKKGLQMAYEAYNGLLTGGWLTFVLVLFAILSVAAILWFIFYVEMSQRKNWKMVIGIVVICALLTAFEIQLILLKINIVF